MIRAIVHVCPYAQHGESAQNTCLGSLLDTFADCGDVLLRNRTAHNRGSKLEGLLAVGLHGSEVYLTVSVLSASTGLSCVLAVHINSLGEGLLVGNLRSTHVCLYVEL